MANPKPAVTFRVNTETLNRQGHIVPNRTQTSDNELISEADNQKFCHTIAMVPGLLMGGMPTGYHHGDTFVVYGKQAQYLKDTYCKGTPNDMLVVITTDWS